MNVQDHEYEYRIKNTISVVKCNNFRSLHHCLQICCHRYIISDKLPNAFAIHVPCNQNCLKVLCVISNDLHTVYSILVYSHHRIVSKLIRVGKNHDFFYLNRIFFNFFFYNS